ncbi:hypothetical protein JRQ81_016564, partial [Phrynocephalus forsythii]
STLGEKTKKKKERKKEKTQCGLWKKSIRYVKRKISSVGLGDSRSASISNKNGAGSQLDYQGDISRMLKATTGEGTFGTVEDMDLVEDRQGAKAAAATTLGGGAVPQEGTVKDLVAKPGSAATGLARRCFTGRSKPLDRSSRGGEAKWLL